MKRRGVSRKNAHTAGYQRYTYQHTAASGPDQPYGRERNRTGSSRDNYDVGSAPNHPIPAHRKLKMDARNVRRRQKRRAATEKAWYAVVKGANLGLYSKWEEVQEHIRLSLELGIRSPKAYRYKSRTLALEGFLRFWNGRRVFPKTSTMRSRGMQYLPAKFLQFKGVAKAYALMVSEQNQRFKFQAPQVIHHSVYSQDTDPTTSEGETSV